MLALGRVWRACYAAAGVSLHQRLQAAATALGTSGALPFSTSSSDVHDSSALILPEDDAYGIDNADIDILGYEGEDTVDFGFQEVPREHKAARVGQVFSSVATSYDVMNDVMSGGLHRLWKDRLVSALLPFPGMQHLDVAGGTGDVAFRVLRAIREAEQAQWQGQQQRQHQLGHVTVCDINPQMLEVGRSRTASMGFAGDPGLSWVEGNAEALPFEDSCMDAYTIAFGIRNVTDRMAALSEAYRVLKPGGRFLCLEFSQVRQPVLRELYDTYSLNVIPKLGAAIASDEASYQYLVESIRRFPDQETFAMMIQEAGFRAVEHEDLTGGIVAMHSGFKL